ncbi:MAG: hypothetical protein L3I99_07675 [Sulfurimonas sp.]|nr:hypothetical protein [Sulfurimonas sp.]
MHEKKITALLEYVKIDKFYISCHFRCKVTNKTVISTVAFEPFDGKIEFTFQDIVFNPIKSYNRYYHTPITIFNEKYKDTIVQKAFEKVSKYFKWDATTQNYIYIIKGI